MSAFGVPSGGRARCGVSERSPGSRNTRLGTLALGAIGVVYGDIGTSPLYAFREAFSHGLAPSAEHVLATLSALFWSLTLIVSIKYVGIVLKFDNAGEGGVLALTALARRAARHHPRWSSLVVTLGVLAAALFYGDAILTPAISVLSAVEGMEVATPEVAHLVVPITAGILLGLFTVQRNGTGRVGGLFGPVTLAWFVTLGTLGALSIARTPAVLAALDPMHAVRFALDFPGAVLPLLAAVFLALTGSEALYADMGHFGARAVRVAWFTVACPALLLNYFGQGALVMRDPGAAANPFYLLAPGGLVLVLIGLATAATVIASQAVITGAYSITLQAVRLGYLPRVRILHTSDLERGQIYIPSVNRLMLVGVLALVVAFRSSGGLAAAYGVAVSGTIVVTTGLLFFVTWMTPGGRRLPLLAALVLFGALELLFLGANMLKIAQGGWLPLLLGACIFTLLVTWKRGTDLVAEQRRQMDRSVAEFATSPVATVPRVPGTAVYLTSDPGLVPSALVHNIAHYKVMHAQTVFLHVTSRNMPRIDPAQALEVQELAPGMYRVTVEAGFREQPDIPAALAGAAARGLVLDPEDTTYFVARWVVVDGPGGLPRWQCGLYAWMTHQAEGAATFFKLPPDRVVELGTTLVL